MTSRLQLALNVSNLDEAADYYSRLFNVPVNKRKPGYANFVVQNPPLKLVLFEDAQAAERINHMGVEVLSDEELVAATQRLSDGGLATHQEEEAVCCYATQNKVWSRDPQGLMWEWYQVLEDSDTYFEAAKAPAEPAGCC